MNIDNLRKPTAQEAQRAAELWQEDFRMEGGVNPVFSTVEIIGWGLLALCLIGVVGLLRGDLALGSIVVAAAVGGVLVFSGRSMKRNTGKRQALWQKMTQGDFLVASASVTRYNWDKGTGVGRASARVRLEDGREVVCYAPTGKSRERWRDCNLDPAFVMAFEGEKIFYMIPVE